MANFDASKEWVILIPPDTTHISKAVEDLSRYIGLLSGLNGLSLSKQPAVVPVTATTAKPTPGGAVIVLTSKGGEPMRNGFSWKAGPSKVEIDGESGRGLCNGIYSFLAALGISWPAPGQEILPSSDGNSGSASCFPLTVDKSCEPSGFEDSDSAFVPLRRFIPASKETINRILKKSGIFAAWAARRRYDALVLPLTVFASGSTGRKIKELYQFAGEYGIALEAGGRDFSSLVPGKFFFFHKDYFRMLEGKRVKGHHFCPTNPGTIRLISNEAGRLFLAARGIDVFHLWPDKGAETTWCSCPTCRAFTPAEQNRIAVNTAADVLASLKPGAIITYFEKDGEEGNIPMRKNLVRMARLPEEKNFRE